MGTIVRFRNVSKEYRLGLTRTSLPSVISGWIRNSIKLNSSTISTKKTFWALKNVSFDLEKGDSLALIGANGAGKTTILKHLANITKPNTGTIEVNGQLSALIELGAGFHPDLTGRENIYLNGIILGLSRDYIESRIDEILDFSELEYFIDTPVKRYSSGMVVRLGFSVASCIEPDILLVDEVLAVGDAAFQQKCMKRIRSLIDTGTSIIFVSHNFYLVQAACDRAIYLEKGKIKYEGEVNDAIAIYEQDIHEARTRKFQLTDNDQTEGRWTENVDNGNVEITKVEVLNANGKPSKPLLSDQPAQIRVHYHAYQSLGKVQMSVFIIRSDGLNCCMKRSYLDDFDLILDRGVGHVTIQLEKLQLISGTYFAEAWFLNDTDSLVISTKGERSDWFSVKGSAMSYDDNSGVFEPIGRWEHQPNSHTGLKLGENTQC